MSLMPWQKALWRFANIGHIGKVNGPKAWQEPVTPLVSKHEMRVKLSPDRDATLYLATSDAGDGSADDEVVWENPRLVAKGRPDLPISGLPALVKHLEAQRAKVPFFMQLGAWGGHFKSRARGFYGQDRIN